MGIVSALYHTRVLKCNRRHPFTLSISVNDSVTGMPRCTYTTLQQSPREIAGNANPRSLSSRSSWQLARQYKKAVPSPHRYGHVNDPPIDWRFHLGRTAFFTATLDRRLGVSQATVRCSPCPDPAARLTLCATQTSLSPLWTATRL